MSFHPPSTATGQTSRRTGGPEIPIGPEIQISVCLDTGIPLPTKLLELARMDLIFITDRPLRFGTLLQMTLFSDFVSAVTSNRAVVHWCRPHPQGWQVGVFLVQPLPDRLTENHWHDLRSTLRYECNWKAWVLWDQAGDLETVKVVDYSIGGMKILLSHPVEQNLSLTLFGSSGSRERAVLNGQVQWCRETDHAFQAGVIVYGQRGRELPRMFGNLDAVHVDSSALEQRPQLESPETQRFEQALDERFLAQARNARNTVLRVHENYDAPE